MRKIAVPALLAVVLSSGCVQGEEPLYARKNEKEDTKGFSWIEEFKKIPPLKHDRGDRWPMILWECVSYEPSPPEVYKMLLARGLTQNIRMDAKMIPTAKALQAAGSPVIMMNGEGGARPYSLAGKPEVWAHQFDEGYKVKKGSYHRPCLGVFKGWQIAADRVRGTLQKYKDAGVTISAVWMDWEGDPLFGRDRYEQAKHCKRCRAMLPGWVMANRKNFEEYCWRLYLELTGTYLAGPTREVFPDCSVTNWMAVYSTPERPVRHWDHRVLPPSTPPMFNATNPVAYGNTVFFKVFWKPSYKLDREHVDQFYTYLLLQQVSANAANVRDYAPQIKAVPWISRWCPDEMDPKIPILSRERYREVLRHLWLRGTEGMQIFNPTWGRQGFHHICVTEVQDAVAVYDEMLACREFLDKGEVLCTDMPAPQDDGVIWSGLRLGDRAVIRTFKQGGGTAKITIEPWAGRKITLQATDKGETRVLVLENEKVRIEK